MKALTIKIGLLGLLTTLILMSCSKNDTLLPSTADRLKGQWKFEKVKFQKNWSLSSTDLTIDYKDLVLEFKNDFSATQTNATTGLQSEGVWEVTAEWYTNTNMGQAVEVLKCSLTDLSSGQTDKFDWENLRVTKKKITATEYKNGETYRYTLIKL